jgi:hypothetical protein
LSAAYRSLLNSCLSRKCLAREKRARLDCEFHRNAAEALPELIRQLRAGGYKVVHMVPEREVTTVPKYDEMVRQQDKLSSDNTWSENSKAARGDEHGAPLGRSRQAG